MNFVYRALGFSDLAIGALAASQALGVVAGAVPAIRFAHAYPRRTVLLVGGTVSGFGLLGILLFDALPALAVSAALIGVGGIVATSTGAALLADASRGTARMRLFGQQTALGAMAAFLASAAAGALASPIAAFIGVSEGDIRALRALVATGALLAGLSAIPVLFLRPAPIALARLAPTEHRGLLRRFFAIEIAVGFGAGSFIPFINLFFSDRYDVPFGALGVVLGILAVAGSVGALSHSRIVVPRLGALRGIVATELAALPFALAAAFVFGPAGLELAVVLLATRAFLMYGSSATLNAFALSSFTPAERAGANASLSIGYFAAYAAGAAVSGWLRASVGEIGWTVNLLSLCGCYFIAAVLQLRFLGRHVPRGDASGTTFAGAPDSIA